MDNKFFTFIKPYLSFIDDGHLYRKPFSWLYTILAAINLILPLIVFVTAINNGIFDMPIKFFFVFFLVWIMIAFAGWVSFQLWWDRKSKITNTSIEGDEFVATPVFSHLIQTFGEWLGTWFSIVGFGTALIATIFLGSGAEHFLSGMGLGMLQAGWLSIILMPLFGFLIIVVTRFLAESFKALSSIV